MIIFATYYQSLLVTLASQRADGSNFTAIDAIRWNNLLLCGEMVIFAVGLLVAFPIKEFIGGIPDRRLLSNVKDVFAVDDVLQNMYTNFNPTYRDYALQRSQAEAPDMGRLNNTFGGSNLSSVAMEMTGVYRGKSKRLAFNSLLRGEQPIKAKLRSSHNSALSTTGLLHEYNDHLYTQSSYRRRSLSGVSNGSVIDNPILEHSSSLPPELMVIRALTSDSVESPLERGRGYTNDGNNEGDCEEGIENDADDDDEEEIYLTPSSPRQLSASSSSSSIIATSIPAPKFRVNLNLAKKVGSKDKLKMTPPRVTAVTSSDTNLFRANSGSDISGVSIFFPSPPGNSSVVNTADPTTAAPIYSSNNSISNNHDSYIDKSNEPTESKEVELLQEKANPNPTEFGMSPAQLERADTVGSGDDSWGEFEACHSSKSDSTVK